MSTKTERRSKQSATCANKLIPRLARYLGNDSLYGKSVVRNILKKGGYKGPRWKNEERAIQILTAAGKDMSGFQRMSKSAAKVAPVIKKVAVTAPSDDVVDRLRRVTIHLMQGKRILLQEIKDGKRADIGQIENALLAALNEARE